MEELLKIFKLRMRIFHDEEDDNLNHILKGSLSYIKRYCGSEDLTNESIKELVIERSRYVYNDQVEFFYQNFKAELMAMSLKNYGGESDEPTEI